MLLWIGYCTINFFCFQKTRHQLFLWCLMMLQSTATLCAMERNTISLSVNFLFLILILCVPPLQLWIALKVCIHYYNSNCINHIMTAIDFIRVLTWCHFFLNIMPGWSMNNNWYYSLTTSIEFHWYMTAYCCCSTIVISQCYNNGDFRLANSSMNFATNGSVIVTGRIEVCSNFSYTSLCSEYWDPVDAQVFCENYLNSIGYYSNISKFNS